MFKKNFIIHSVRNFFKALLPIDLPNTCLGKGDPLNILLTGPKLPVGTTQAQIIVYF